MRVIGSRASGIHLVAGLLALACGRTEPPTAAPPSQRVEHSGAAVGASDAAPAAPDAAPRLQLAAPPAPDAGAVTLRFTGAFEHEATGAGVVCDPDDPSWVHMASVDVDGPDARPLWTLELQPSASEPVHTVVVVIGPFDANTGYSGTSAVPGVVASIESGATWGVRATLRAGKRRRAIEVEGEIRCPRAGGSRVGKEVLTYLREVTGAEPRAYATHDFGRARDPASASVVLPEHRARAVLPEVRAGLGPGWVAFIGTNRWLGDEKHDGVELVVGAGADPFDILRLARSDAVNYGMGTEALIKKLQAYDALAGVEIVQASTDTIEVTLSRLPSDLAAFADDVYAFCPDIVDQGTGTKDALIAAVRAQSRLVLWWD